MGRILKKGEGWRIGWNPDPTCPFQGLVGADDWAVELTTAEFSDFCRLLTQLAETVEAIAPELMAEENINIEAESDLIWLEIDGLVGNYDLRMLVSQNRSVEGNWLSGSVTEIVKFAQIFHQTQELPL